MSSTYIIIPGSVTGDLWHVAAAQILSSQYDNTFPPLIAVVAVTARKADDTPQDKLRKDEEFQNGRVTFNYLRFIGLKVMLLKLIGTDAGTPKIEQATYSQPDTWFDDAYKAQTGEHKDLKEGRFIENLTFDQLMELDVINATKTDLKNQKFPKLNSFDNKPAYNRVLQLKIATTIAMNLLRDPLTRQQRREFLAKRMYSGAKDSYIPEIYRVAGKQKYDILTKLIGSIKSEYAKKKKQFDGIILENYRKGHVNGGTDTTYQLSVRLEKLANNGNLAVIAIPATATEEGYNEVKRRYGTAVLDLYNKTEVVVRTNPDTKVKTEVTVWGNTPWPGLDPRAQTYFWNLVAADKTIRGLIGGRSGSIDVAAFCGVRTLFWDEPWLRYACIPTKNQPKVPIKFLNWIDYPPKNDAKAIVQVPQCLRSQQLMLLMGITAPVRIMEGSTWLWGDFAEDVTKDDISKKENRAKTDELPNFKLKREDETTLSLKDMRKDLERDDLGIHASVVDDWMKG